MAIDDTPGSSEWKSSPIASRSTALCSFVEAAVEPQSVVTSEDCSEYATLASAGYQHRVEAAEKSRCSMVRLVFLSVKMVAERTRHGVSPKHLQAYLDEFAFRFNRPDSTRSAPSTSCSELGLARKAQPMMTFIRVSGSILGLARKARCRDPAVKRGAHLGLRAG